MDADEKGNGGCLHCLSTRQKLPTKLPAFASVAVMISVYGTSPGKMQLATRLARLSNEQWLPPVRYRTRGASPLPVNKPAIVWPE